MVKLVGGFFLDWLEDIEIDFINGNVLVVLINNLIVKNYFGFILKIEEVNGDYEVLIFKLEVYLVGGEDIGFVCLDNMVFDLVGNLWFIFDMFGSLMNKELYIVFKNNGLFFVLREGE